jgi:Zn-finger nucleic acid-binding protein
MQCPVCETVDLAMSSREGVEIDYCPKCRGVWLDRGELDKIIEREAADRRDDDRGRDDRRRDHDDDRSRRDQPKPKKKKESFFERLMEFGE